MNFNRRASSSAPCETHRIARGGRAAWHGLTSALLMALVVAAARPAAAEPALEFTGFTPIGVAGRTVGYTFTVDEPMLVRRLGLWDRNHDGVEEDRPVGLWDSAGNLLASVTLLQGTEARLVGDFRYEDVDSTVWLESGETYTVGALYQVNNGGICVKVTGLTTLDGFNIGSARGTNADGIFARPTGNYGTYSPGFFGPTLDLVPASQMLATPAFAFTGSTPVGVAGRTAGYTFTVDRAVIVADLGLWDRDHDGNEEDRPIGLWDSAGTLLGSITLLEADADAVLDGDFLYKPLDTSVMLEVGETYTVGVHYDVNNGGISHLATGLSQAEGVSMGQGRGTNIGAGFARPTGNYSASTPGFFGPNLRVVYDAGDIDDDGDGLPNDEDNCDDVVNVGQADLDGDGMGDDCDADQDGDDVDDVDDAFPRDGTETADTDEDGVGNNADPDDDDDGVPDDEETACGSDPLDGNSVPSDGDTDGICDAVDNCAALANANQADGDGDAIGDVCDDGDADGVVYAEDCDDANGQCTTDCTDADSDGYCVTTDCDDAVSGCTTDCTDVDNDGVAACNNDCDDADPDNFPGNPEICDGKDNDCTGFADLPTFIAGSGVPLELPDRNPPQELTVDVDLAGNVTDVNVTIDVTHTWIADIRGYLRSPSGVEIDLIIRRGGGGDDLQGTIFDDEADEAIGDGRSPFAGSYRPEEPLSTFDGEAAAGTWTLRIWDAETNDTGTLNDWSLSIATDGVLEVDSDADGAPVCSDCDDTNPHCDADCTDADGDGYCVTTDCDESNDTCTSDCTDADSDGYCVTADCDDDDLDRHPGAGEQCDGVDNDCNGIADWHTAIEGSGVPLDLPDRDPPQELSVDVGLVGDVTDVNVMLDVTHTWVADIRGYLRSPSGVEIDLIIRRGGGGDFLQGTTFDDEADEAIGDGSSPFAGSYRPEEPLSTFDGEVAAGTWTLRIWDAETNDIGTLNDWRLYIATDAVIETDQDADGVCSAGDNCPDGANSDQLDTDGDGTGDVCDDDDDDDGASDTLEGRCNSDPLDDADLPADGDADTICDALDNCPSAANADQTDSDGFTCGGATDCETESGCTYVPGDGTAYLVCTDDTMRYLDASALCEGMGGHLAVIGDAQENALLTSAAGGVTVWIGYDDLTDEGAFVWVDGSAADYENWSGGEPNDLFDEDCAELRSNGTWNDARCPGAQRSWICEAGDGAADACDNCPGVLNADQADVDADDIGDLCDACPVDAANDGDADGHCGDVDNCPADTNANQQDTDQDGAGDVCDVCPLDDADDSDADGACADADNCPVDTNADQADADGDGQGDLCDDCANDPDNDGDGDGLCGDVDNCSTVANADQLDDDSAGFTCGNRAACETATGGCSYFTYGDSVYFNCPEDSHRRTVLNAQTFCESFGGHLATLNDQAENDRLDGTGERLIGNHDMDGDGLFGGMDGGESTYTNWRAGEPDTSACTRLLRDGSWTGFSCNGGTRGFICEAETSDGVGDVCDNCPIHSNHQQIDSDEDGLGDVCDNCPTHGNVDQNDSDSDGTGDLCDACPNDADNDADEDGHCADADNCPSETNADQNDSDGDGTGDPCDPCPNDPDDDGDGDGLCAGVDNCPVDTNADQADRDGNGVGDACDDGDGDGVVDAADNCPDTGTFDLPLTDFSDISDLTVNRDASQSGTVLRMTPNSSDSASFFLTNPLPFDEDTSFQVYFRARMHGGNGTDRGADGMVFVIHNDADGPTARGGTGSSLAYTNINNSLGVAYDTFGIAESINEVRVVRNGNANSNLGTGDPAPVDLNGAATFYNWIDYDGATNTLEVYISSLDEKPGAPLITVERDLHAELSGDQAYFGFTASTGGFQQRHDVEAWQISMVLPGQSDGDADGVGDLCDLCPEDVDPDQSDADSDGVGDLCDNCPADANADQVDGDSDGIGDLCDDCPADPEDDADGDAQCGDVDNCPAESNADQADLDGDGAGDVCDDDRDGDGFGNDEDFCPDHLPLEFDFSDFSDLTLNRDAAQSGTVLRMTPASSDAASFFRTDPIGIDADTSFQAYFQARMHGGNSPDSGADGMVFVVHNDSDGPTAIGGTGSGLGYSNINRSIGIAYDTFGIVGGINEVRVMRNGSTNSNLGSADPDPVDLNGGTTFYNWIDYDGTTDTLEIYLSSVNEKPGTPLITVERDLHAELSGDQAYFGFTASTGGFQQRHDVEAWSLVVNQPGAIDSDDDGQGDICDACPYDPGDDTDDDGLCGDVDNCPDTANVDQNDNDQDGLGDACDVCPDDPSNDVDEDGVCGAVDNCPDTANADQNDVDLDGVGDACDVCPADPDDDIDQDGICGDVDNCVDDANADQSDNDQDGAGDACDGDDDNDGLTDVEDNCPLVVNASETTTHEDFSDISGLTLNGDAAQVGDVLRVASNARGRRGSVFVTEPFALTESTTFETAFEIRMHDGGAAGRSGMTFVIQNTANGPTTLGGSGGGLGFRGIGDASVGVELDTESGADDDNNDNHVAVVKAGNNHVHLGEAVPPFDLNGVDRVFAWITYDADGVLAIYLSTDATQPAAALLEVGIDLHGQLGDQAYFGFSAANTSMAFQHHDVESWSLTVGHGSQADLDGDGAGDVCDDDDDADGVDDSDDNCPIVGNPTQIDTDEDGPGDACDLCPADPNDDEDGDEICADVDNCPAVTNVDQTDIDEDGQGDVCDLCPVDPNDDEDGDGLCGDVDNCPVTLNVDQTDIDEDGQGDVCDVCPVDPNDDEDGDGLCGDVDNCPATLNVDQADTDEDDQGDACDLCPADPDNDADGDEICGDVDNCPGDANFDQQDTDTDDRGDACDLCPADPNDDEDEDGLCGDVDNCPAILNIDQADTDEDGQGDVCDICPADPDDDADGDEICSDADNCPGDTNFDQQDTDGDALGDACDACPQDPDNDVDVDTVCGDIDNCPAVANPDQHNTDGDLPGDLCDVCPNDADDDIDGDGLCADVDNCPAVANPDQADINDDGFADACVSIDVEVPDNAMVGDGVQIGTGSTVGDEAIVGNDTVIGDNVDIQPDAVIGDMTEIGTGTTIGEDAVIGDGASLDANVQVGQGSSVGNGATVGDDTSIGSNVVVGEDTAIGTRVEIDLNAEIGSDVTIGDQVTLDEGAEVAEGSEVGSDVVLMAEAEVGAGCVVGDQVELQPHVNVGEGCELGEGATIGSQSDVANGVSIGAGVSIGTHANIGEDVEIGDNAQIADSATLEAGTVVRDGATVGASHIGTGVSIGAEAQIGNASDIGNDVTIEPGAIIADQVEIGDGVVIGEGTVVSTIASVGQETTIGRSCEIAPNVTLADHVQVGDDVIIEDNNDIGAGTSIGASAMLWSGSHIGEEVVIGSGCKLGSSLSIGDRTELGMDCQVWQAASIGSDNLFGAAPVVQERTHVGMGNRFGDRVTLYKFVSIGNDNTWGDDVYVDKYAHIGDRVLLSDDTYVPRYTNLPDDTEQ